MNDEMTEVKKKRDITWHAFFNYCCKDELKYLNEIKKTVEHSHETGNHLLARLLTMFKKYLPEDEYLVTRKDLCSVANNAKNGKPIESISKYVTGTPSWEYSTKDERRTLKNAKWYAASHLSSLIRGILLEKKDDELF